MVAVSKADDVIARVKILNQHSPSYLELAIQFFLN